MLTNGSDSAECEVTHTSYPTLKSWLRDAPAGNPWSSLLEEKFDAFLQPMEAILAELERVQPTRLPRKRVEFRNDLKGLWPLRSELNVGYRLGQGGLSFDMGDDGQADYACSLSTGNAWVEVTTRTRDDLRKLHDELEEGLGTHSVGVVLNVRRLLRIPEDKRVAICRRVQETVEAGGGDGTTVTLPEIDGSASITAPSPFGRPDVMLNIAPDLADHTAEIEQEVVLGAVPGKIEQATRGSWDSKTLVVLDASRLGLSWLRSDSVWAGRLSQMPLPWEAMPFFGFAVVFSDLTKVGFHGSCVARPGLGAADKALLEELLIGLGFSAPSA
jgi:hypothetical protein